MLNDSYILYVIFFMALATLITRAFPFIFLARFKDLDFMHYLAKMLPLAILVLLVIYCNIHLSFTKDLHKSLLQIFCLALVALVHLWKRKVILSVFSGSLIYIGVLNYIL